MEVGRKDDSAKPDLSLISPIWLLGVARIMTFGAKKYSAHNWRNGIVASRLIAACFRHLYAYLSGEDRDPETGELHLYHASCCLMFLAEQHEMRPQFDDRWKPNDKAKEDEEQNTPNRVIAGYANAADNSAHVKRA